MDAQGSVDVESAFEAMETHFELPTGARCFAHELVEGVAAHRAALDQLIDATARNWRLARMAIVDRNLLRLAGFELLYTDTAAAVVIDEAVELAHRFGGDASPGFVNGILDALARGKAAPASAQGDGG